MTTTETFLIGFGLQIPKEYNMAWEDDAEYYRDFPEDNQIWDTDFKKHGLKVVNGQDRNYVGLFDVDQENISFDMISISHSYSYNRILSMYEEAKYAFYKVIKDHPEYKKWIGDVRDIKFIAINLYS